MLLVKDVMTGNPISVPEKASIDVAIELMVERNISCVPVVNDFGALVGLITEYDVLQLFGEGGTSSGATQICRDFMTPKVRTIRQDASLAVAAKIFKVASLRRLLVVEGEKLVGVLSRRDVVKSIRDGRVTLAAN